jgi:BMFP domain-containing protein YqiC
MQKDKIFDEFSRMMSGATGALFDFKREVEGMVSAQMERFLARMNLVTRDEFEALRETERATRERCDALKLRLEDLENRVGLTIKRPREKME